MKFSIITITFNSDKYLETTIKSVLRQTVHDFEYLFIDGGSSDSTLEIIRHYAESDSRIKWLSEKDEGISDAMNKGIAMSTGEVIAHLHSDDFYAADDVLASVDSAFEDAGTAWATGGMFIIDTEGNRLDEIRVRPYRYQNLIDGNTLLHPSTFVRSSVFKGVGGFDTKLRFAMDYDMWLRIGRNFGAPVLVDQPLSCFRVHNNSISSFEAEKATAEEWAVRKRYIKGNPIKFLQHYYMFLKTRKHNAQYFKKLMKTSLEI